MCVSIGSRKYWKVFLILGNVSQWSGLEVQGDLGPRLGAGLGGAAARGGAGGGEEGTLSPSQRGRGGLGWRKQETLSLPQPTAPQGGS